MPRCFISYARADDEPFVKRLRDRLKRMGVDVWWDRDSMRSRDVRFLQEIQDAIASADWFVLVSGPAAATSDYVGNEVAVARRACVPAALVLRQGDRKDVPRRLHHQHQFDLRSEEEGREFRSLLKTLSGPPPQAGRLLGLVPPPPAHLLDREPDLEQVVDAVLADVTDPSAVSTTAPAAAVSGMAGAGKSVLAAMVVRDCQVRRHFVGGVVYASLGQTATAESAALALRRSLHGSTAESSGGATAFTDLRESAGLARRLFVLDDVWTSDQLDPLLQVVADTRSRLLLTTRQIDLGRGSGVVHHHVGVLDPDTAHQFLMQWVPRDRGTAVPPEGLTDVARACGYLPLGLAVAGALVGPVLGWPELAQQLRGTDLQALDLRSGPYEHRGIYAAIDVSVRQLEGDLWARYRDLALFDDGPVPVSVVQTLWGAEDDAARARARLDLTVLIGRSLLTSGSGDAVGLHDLHRAYLLARGAVPAELAGRMVTALGGDCREWIARAATEPWVRNHLVALLDTARRPSAVAELLRTTDDVGLPAWHEIRRIAGETDGFWSDLDIADRHARGRLTEPDGLGSAVGYVAVRATLRSFSRNRPPALTSAAVRAGLLSPLEAWQEAKRVPERTDRLSALAQLVPLLPTDEERDKAVREFLDELRGAGVDTAARVLPELLSRWSPTPDMVDAVLDLLDEVGCDRLVPVALTPFLDDGQLDRARTLVTRFLDGPPQRWALAGLTRAVAEDEACRIVGELCAELPGRVAAQVVLAATAPDRPRLARMLAERVEAALPFRPLDPRDWYAATWPALPPDRLGALLGSPHDLVEFVFDGLSPLEIGQAYIEIVRQHPWLAEAVVASARRLRSAGQTILVLGYVLRTTATGHVQLVDELVQRVRSTLTTGKVSWMTEKYAAETLAALPAELLPELVRAAESLDHPPHRGRAVAALASVLPVGGGRRLLRRELERLDRHPTTHDVDRAIVAVVPSLDPSLLSDALLVATSPRDDGFETSWLARLTDVLDQPRRSRIHEWVLSRHLPGGAAADREDWEVARTVGQIVADRAVPDVVALARKVAVGLRKPESRVEAVAAVAAANPEADLWPLVDDALGAVPGGAPQAWALARVARLAPPDRRAGFVDRCLRTAREIPADDQYIRQLEDLIVSGEPAALDFVVDVIRSTGDRFDELYRLLPAEALAAFEHRSDDELIIARAVRSAEAGNAEEALHDLADVESAWNEGVRELAPRLSEEAVWSLLTGPRELSEWSVGALCIALGRHGDVPSGLRILRERVGEHWSFVGTPTLAAFAALDAVPARRELVDEALDDLTAAGVVDFDNWLRTLGHLADAVAALPVNDRPPRLSRLLDLVGGEVRLRAVPALWVLAPAYVAVAGPDGAWEAFEAVCRSLEWWPSHGRLARSAG